MFRYVTALAVAASVYVAVNVMPSRSVVLNARELASIRAGATDCTTSEEIDKTECPACVLLPNQQNPVFYFKCLTDYSPSECVNYDQTNCVACGSANPVCPGPITLYTGGPACPILVGLTSADCSTTYTVANDAPCKNPQLNCSM